MGVVCQACGAENHGGVTQCRLCAAALPAAPEAAGRERSRSRRGSKAAPKALATRWWLAVGLGALAVMLFWTLGAPRGSGHPAVAAAPPTTAEPVKPAGNEPASAPADNLTQATAAAQARLKASLERLAREDQAREEAHARERAAAERRQREAELARRRDATASVARAEPSTPPQDVKPAATEPAPTRRPLPESRPAAVTAVVPAAAPTVEQRCADSGNFFSRALCQSQACADPALAQDPACRRLREINQATRPDPALLN